MSKKALIVQGGWEGHEPKECAELWARILVEEEFDVTVADSLDIFKDAVLLANLSVITPIWTMGVIDADQFDGLSKAVAAGVGLAGWHGGMADAFREHLGYQYMVGGQFMDHPDGIKDYEVNMVATDDPITKRHCGFFGALGTVLHAHRSRQRGAGNDHVSNREQPLGQWHRNAGDLEAALGRRQGVLLFARSQGERVRSVRGNRDPTPRHLLGVPRPAAINANRGKARQMGVATAFKQVQVNGRIAHAMGRHSQTMASQAFAPCAKNSVGRWSRLRHGDGGWTALEFDRCQGFRWHVRRS